jgi:hypothetical protein
VRGGADATFHSGAEEKVAGFRNQRGLVAIARLKAEVLSATGDGAPLAGGEFIRAGEVIEGGGIGRAPGGVFVKPHGLAHDDLPLAVAVEPGVDGVVAGVEELSVDGFVFIGFVGEDGDSGGEECVRVHDFYRAAVALRHGLDVGKNGGLIHGAAFFVVGHGVVGVISGPGSFVSGDECVVELPGATD